MKKITIYFFLSIATFFWGYDSFAQNNKAACVQVEQRLKIIKDYVDGKNSDSSLRRAEAIAFFEKLTGIASNSDIIAENKLEPSIAEYHKWNNWYQENMSKLYWDKRKKQVRVKK